MSVNASVPLLIVFGLEYTLFPLWVGLHYTPPFSKTSSGDIVDDNNVPLSRYDDVPEILERLKKNGYKIAATSISLNPDGVKQLIQLLDWEKYFSYVEINKGDNKMEQFERINKKSGIAYRDMLFFDDSIKHIYDVSTLGVVSIHIVDGGMTETILEDGLRMFEAKRS